MQKRDSIIILFSELPIQPTCIKVCTKEEYQLKQSGKKILPKTSRPYAHGKLMYAVKVSVPF